MTDYFNDPNCGHEGVAGTYGDCRPMWPSPGSVRAPTPFSSVQCVDCLEGLRGLPPTPIDAVITDAPYWLGSRFSIDGRGQYVGSVTDCKHAGQKWRIGDGYWLEQVFAQYHRVLKHGGFVVSFCIDRMADLPTYNARKARFEVCQSLYWQFRPDIPKGTDTSKRVDALLL